MLYWSVSFSLCCLLSAYCSRQAESSVYRCNEQPLPPPEMQPLSSFSPCVCLLACVFSPLAPRPCTARPPSQCVHGPLACLLWLRWRLAGDAWRSRYSAGRRGVSLEGLTWFSGFEPVRCRRQGERRGARMLACWSKGWGVQPKQAWWSRLAKAVVQRLWRPRGTGCMRAVGVCVPCARMQCISQTLTNMYTAPGVR